MGNSVLFLSATVPILIGKKVRNIASIAQNNQSTVVEMVSQFVKGVQDLQFTKRKMGHSLI